LPIPFAFDFNTFFLLACYPSLPISIQLVVRHTKRAVASLELEQPIIISRKKERSAIKEESTLKVNEVQIYGEMTFILNVCLP